MSDKSWLQRLTDALPWNQARKRDAERAELEREILAMDTEPAPKTTSAAEAMAAMKAESKAKRAPSASESDGVDDDGKKTSGTLHERWRATAKDGPSQADKDDLKRNRGA